MIAMQTRYWLDSRSTAGPRSCGDFADCFPLDAYRQAIVVGDVAGRGRAAGNAAAAVLQYAREALTTRAPLRTMLAVIDERFSAAVSSPKVPIASLFLAIRDAKDDVLDYASAGHEPGLHFTTQTRHEHLDPTGPLLGLSGLGPSGFTQRRVHLCAGSLLVLVTDGVTEARRYVAGEPQFFGSTGVARALVEARRARRDPADAITSAAAAHADGMRDDSTAIVVDIGTQLTGVGSRFFGGTMCNALAVSVRTR